MAKRAKEARAEDSEPSESESGSSSSSSERKQPKETQPKMIDMIIDALNNMDDRKGASPMYLKKFILGLYPQWAAMKMPTTAPLHRPPLWFSAHRSD
ncbi:uncharacterized protein LOC119372859 isoform X3 [Rhipicephalus sanguineus]|uniref:uncharacterized protein LOC119372859 isoform X3 n=1 Tax=Rhipicephalus sanguineus TaxID=34632 RepID=UPI0020C468C4|nr:uncharacterized protein LOC119372859 isoform X3 [Rhipicephalus sanguineus]